MDSQSSFHLINDSDFQLITFIRLKRRRSRQNLLDSGWFPTFSLNRKITLRRTWISGPGICPFMANTGLRKPSKAAVDPVTLKVYLRVVGLSVIWKSGLAQTCQTGQFDEY
jgi:hypothetical protein